MNESIDVAKNDANELGSTWDNLGKNNESWEEHLANAHKRINLRKPTVKVRDENGNIVEQVGQPTKTIYSLFDRYPEQASQVRWMMHEAYDNNELLKVLNIGVARGQEALGYVQMAADIAGENNIQNALDLELVEYAADIPIMDKTDLPENISSTSHDYLSQLYQSPKAHFDTPFQGFVGELKNAGEKRDVVLFNNVIQHLDYSVPKEEMLKDMQNLADVVADNGVLCMTCEPHVLSKYENVKGLFDSTDQLLKESGFTEVESGVYLKNNSQKTEAQE